MATRDHDPRGPAGPSAFWKLSDEIDTWANGENSAADNGDDDDDDDDDGDFIDEDLELEVIEEIIEVE